MSDGWYPHCISCKKHHYYENQEKTREYYSENRDKNLKILSKKSR